MKKYFYLSLTISCMLMLCGCGNSDVTDEVSESSSAQGNALESAFLSEDHFELREESITIEYGTPLSDDISEYVIAKDYSIISYECEEISANDALINKVPGKVTFTRDYGEQLIMTVNYVDTISPTIEKTEYTYYTIKLNRDAHYAEGLPVLFENIAPHGVLNPAFQIFDIEEYFGITDNSLCIPSSLIIDGNSYELDETIPSQTLIPASAFDYGDHNISITVYDTVGHTETFECILHVVKDVSPEEREEMIASGYTEEQINDAVEEFVTQ